MKYAILRNQDGKYAVEIETPLGSQFLVKLTGDGRRTTAMFKSAPQAEEAIRKANLPRWSIVTTGEKVV